MCKWFHWSPALISNMLTQICRWHDWNNVYEELKQLVRIHVAYDVWQRIAQAIITNLSFPQNPVSMTFRSHSNDSRPAVHAFLLGSLRKPMNVSFSRMIDQIYVHFCCLQAIFDEPKISTDMSIEIRDCPVASHYTDTLARFSWTAFNYYFCDATYITYWVDTLYTWDLVVGLIQFVMILLI